MKVSIKKWFTKFFSEPKKQKPRNEYSNPDIKDQELQRIKLSILKVDNRIQVKSISEWIDKYYDKYKDAESYNYLKAYLNTHTS